MIHYTCDRCRRQINTDDQPRYVVVIEIQSIADDSAGDEIPNHSGHGDNGVPYDNRELEEDLDQLTMLHHSLEDMDEPALHEEVTEDASHRGRYDLCANCHREYLANPIGREAATSVGFSNN